MKGIEDYSPKWPQKYELESEKIRVILNDEIKDIQHIGSTSIPGMMAKPLIDIGVLVDSIDDINLFIKNLNHSDMLINQICHLPSVFSFEKAIRLNITYLLHVPSIHFGSAK